MQKNNLVAGYSELKSLLVRTHDIQCDPALVRLFFTADEYEQLWMHDYHDHKKKLKILESAHGQRSIGLPFGSFAYQLVEAALTFDSPATYLNEGFVLHGT